jgi:hypothetical protein
MIAGLPERWGARHSERMGNTPSSPFASSPDHKALIDTDKAVEGIQARLPEQAANATVDCGTPRVRVVEATVTRLKFSTGDQFDRPQHGLYMGAYVTAHALADGQDVLDMYALERWPPLRRGRDHRLDRVRSASRTCDAQHGRADVPARHGQLVLHDLDGHTVGVWKY